MRSIALLSAVDTGSYQSICVNRANFLPLPHNCTAYTPIKELGTLDHFNHLFLINQDFWKWDAFVDIFARLEGDWGSHPLSRHDLIRYFEAMPAGAVNFPDDVRFLIGSFPELFGSANGVALQEW